MKVVLDTNVLVSGILNPHGPPGRLVDAVLSGVLEVLHDDRLVGEYREVLARPVLHFRPVDIEVLVGFIEDTGTPVTAGPLDLVLPDPADLPFLEVAVAGGADMLITGNVKHFRPRRGRHGITVCTPAEAVARLLR